MFVSMEMQSLLKMLPQLHDDHYHSCCWRHSLYLREWKTKSQPHDQRHQNRSHLLLLSFFLLFLVLETKVLFHSRVFPTCKCKDTIDLTMMLLLMKDFSLWSHLTQMQRILISKFHRQTKRKRRWRTELFVSRLWRELWESERLPSYRWEI